MSKVLFTPQDFEKRVTIKRKQRNAEQQARYERIMANLGKEVED